MNDSGSLVLRAVERWRPMASGLLVVHDELDLPLGEVREKEGGGHGGHNGLRDVQMRLGSAGFQRLRIGIGRPPGSHGPRRLRAAVVSARGVSADPERRRRGRDGYSRLRPA